MYMIYTTVHKYLDIDVNLHTSNKYLFEFYQIENKLMIQSSIYYLTI